MRFRIFLLVCLCSLGLVNTGRLGISLLTKSVPTGISKFGAAFVGSLKKADQMVPKSIKIGFQRIRACMYNTRLIKTVFKSKPRREPSTQYSARSNAPEASAAANGGRVSHIRSELSNANVKATVEKQANLDDIELIIAHPRLRVEMTKRSEGISPDEVLFQMHGSPVSPEEVLSTLTNAKRVQRQPLATEFSTRGGLSLETYKTMPFTEQVAAMQRARANYRAKHYPTESTTAPLDPMNFRGTVGGTNRIPSHPPIESAGGVYSRPGSLDEISAPGDVWVQLPSGSYRSDSPDLPRNVYARSPRDPSPRPASGSGSGVDLGGGLQIAPVMSRETGRLIDRMSSRFVSSEMMALPKSGYISPRGVVIGVTLGLDIGNLELNSARLMTDVPDDVARVQDNTVYNFTKEILKLKSMEDHIISPRFKTIAFYETVCVKGARGIGYDPNTCHQTTTLSVSTVYFAGTIGIPIENTSALVAVGVHGYRNGFSGKLRFTFDVVWDTTLPSSMWDPEKITRPDSKACDPELVEVGFYCYDFWDGLHSRTVTDDGWTWDANLQGMWSDPFRFWEYFDVWDPPPAVKDLRYAIRAEKNYMIPPRVLPGPGGSTDWNHVRSYYCNSICGSTSLNGELACQYCFQTKVACSPPLPFFKHVSSGCNLNLAGNWLCGDMCLQDCDPNYFHLMFEPSVFGDYNDFVYTVSDFASLVMSLGKSVEFYLTLATKVYLFNYGGKCCLQCPEGYFNPTCIGHKVFVDELSEDKDYYFEFGDPGTCRKCRDPAGYPTTGFCSDLDDTPTTYSRCEDGYYIQNYNPHYWSEDVICVPCPVCTVHQWNIYNKGTCDRDRGLQVICQRCNDPYPLPEMESAFTALGNCQFRCNAGYEQRLLQSRGVYYAHYACCSSCILGQTYEFAECRVDRNTECRQCRYCQSGKVTSSECTLKSNSVCTWCLAGTFWYVNNTKPICVACPPSTYQDDYGQYFCYNCPSDTYYHGWGLTNKWDCKPLPVGTSLVPFTPYFVAYVASEYNRLTGLWKLYSCPPSMYFVGYIKNFWHDQLNCSYCMGWRTTDPAEVVPTNITSCKCVQGTYDRVGHCIPCEAGKYSDVLGAQECKYCPVGTYSLPVPSSLYQNYDIYERYYYFVGLERNNYLPPNTRCIQCDFGMYTKFVGSTGCIPCEAGYYCGRTGKQQCPIGSYCPPGTSGPIACGYPEACPVPGLGRPREYSYCPVGEYNTGQYSCAPCPVMLGTYHAYYVASDLSKGNCLHPVPGESYSYCYIGCWDQIGCQFCPPGCICNNDFRTYNALPLDMPRMNDDDQCGVVLKGIDVCRLCPAGKYADTSHARSCKWCDAGKYSSAIGATAPCTTFCPAGTGCRNASVAPTYCGDGFYTSSMGQSRCYQCDIGTYKFERGATTCLACGAGFFNTANGSSFCEMCPQGTASSSLTSTGCTDCEVGTFNVGGGNSLCYSCVYGEYRIAETETCVSCAPGTYGVSTYMTTCIFCSSGFFGNGSGMSTCDVCAAGKFSSAHGMSHCVSCGPGQVGLSIGSSSCVTCLSGKYASGYEQTMCSTCELGYNSPNSGMSQCFACAAGSYSSQVSSSGCTLCDAGAYQDTYASFYCNLCVKGKYSNQMGAASCEYCLLGQYSQYPGSVGCETCAVNTFSPFWGMDRCYECAAGYVAPSTGMNTCDSCRRGTYKPDAKLTSCLVCDFGKYSSQTAATTCLRCEGNQYANDLASSACNDCPSGSWVKHPSHASCDWCEIGKYREFQSPLDCTVCDLGLYQSSQGMSSCDMCLTGTFGSFEGASMCTPCSQGLFVSVNGSSQCYECNTGKYQNDSGMSMCKQCNPGYFSDMFGQTECSACVPGLFASGYGQSVCSQCSVGAYQSVSGMSSCVVCEAGSFSSGTQASQCQSCQSGTYGSTQRQTECTFCDIGKYTSSVGNVGCQGCPMGKYSRTVGVTSCISCIIGKFSDEIASLECKACAIGLYQSGIGSSACDGCGAGTHSYVTGSIQCECLECELGYYGLWDVLANTYTCLPCPIGFYCIPCKGPVGCPVGTYHQRWTTTPSYERIWSGSKFYVDASNVRRDCVLPCICNDQLQRVNWIPEFGVCGDPTGPASSLDACVKCTAGSYGSVTGLTACKLCNAGKYSLLIGAPNSSVCLDCAPGYYNSEPGNVYGCDQCELCIEVGRFQNTPCGYDQEGTCMPCHSPFGTYYTGRASNSSKDDCKFEYCQTCPPGTFYSLVCTRWSKPICTPCSLYIAPGATMETYVPHSIPSGYYYLPTKVEYTSTVDGYWDYTFQQVHPCAYAKCSECLEIGTYPVSPCNLTHDTVCAKCNKDQPTTYFISDGRDPVTACQTMSCSYGCRVDQIVVDLCTDYHDYICSPCPIIAPYIEYYRNWSHACQTRPCPRRANEFFSGPLCEQVRTCTLCSGIGQYYISYCNQTSDAICGLCSNKPENSFYTSAGIPDNANNCEYKSSCKVGEYIRNASCTPCSSVGLDLCMYNGVQVGTLVGTCRYTDTSDTEVCLCNSGYYHASRFQCIPCRPSDFCGVSGVLEGYCGPTTSSDPTTCRCNAGFYQSNPLACEWCLDPLWCAPSAGGYLVGSCVSTNSSDQSFCVCPPGFNNLFFKSCVFRCAPGTYQPFWTNSTQYVEMKCSNCPNGTYFTGYGATVCVECQYGKYHTLSGVTTEDTCFGCGVGKYFVNPNGPECIRCGFHSYGPTINRTSCVDCPDGTYLESVGATSREQCVSCPAGTYMSNISNRLCTLCGSRQYQTGTGMYGNGDACLHCPVGTYQTGKGMSLVTDCKPCQPGYYGEYTYFTGFADCFPCWEGKYQTGYALLFEKSCLSCEPGKYQQDIGVTTCNLCGSGKYQTGYEMVARTSCKQCKTGQYSIMNRSRCICSQGEFTDVLSDNCVKCKYANPEVCGNAVVSVIPCSGYTYQDVSQCLCDVGWYSPMGGVCTPCPPGTYQSAISVVGESGVCSSCDIGKYQPEWSAINATRCVLCPVGTYSNVTGVGSVTGCKSCSTGYYQSSEGANSSLYCSKCRAGTYQPMEFASSSSWCLSCPPGSYATKEAQPSIYGCILCESGKYQPLYHSTGPCHQCKLGEYQGDNVTYGVSACLLCPPGTYNSRMAQYGVASCQKCASGTYQTGSGVESSTECIACYTGTYVSQTGSTSNSSCLLCQPGTYGTGYGLVLASNCSKCGVGTYSTAWGVTNESACELCPIGSYGTGFGFISSWYCVACSSGTYQTSSGMSNKSSCLLCSFGTYSVDASVYMCSPCEVGTYTGVRGSSNCTPCSPGYFAERPNSTSCDACPTGTFQNFPESSTCVECHYGLFMNELNATVCTYCGPGEFQNNTGSSQCDMCSPGTYQSGFGAPLCKLCQVGTYLSSSGAYWSNQLGTAGFVESGTFKGYEWTWGYGPHTVLRIDFRRVSLANNLLARFVIRDCDNIDCTEYVTKHTFTRGSDTGANVSLIITRGYAQISLIVRTRCVGNSTTCALAYYEICGDNMVDCFVEITWEANASSFCMPCEMGTYGDLSGGSNCSACNPGYYQSGLGADRCSICGIGVFSPDLGATKCTQCYPGTFKAVDIVGNCDLCTSGKYASGRESTQCLNCTPGTHNDKFGASLCDLCPMGYISVESMEVNCSACEIGKFTNKTGMTECEPCIPGSFGNVTGLFECSQCTPGKYQLFNSSTQCVFCEVGRYATGWGTSERCSICPYEFENIEGAETYDQVCRGCYPGTYEGASGCIECPLGTYSSVTHATVCAKCQSGTYNNVRRAMTSTQCILCPAGSFGVSPGASACELCPPRTFSKIPNSTECLPCIPGYYGYMYGQSDCFPCSKGMYSSSFGSFFDECFICSPGTYANETGSTECQPCSVGFFTNQNGSWKCSFCDSGTYQNETGQSQCIVCPPGSYSPNYGASQCEMCSPGMYQDSTQSIQCIMCPSGTYASTSGTTSPTCVMCGAGTYSTLHGASSFMACDLCSPGYASKVLGLNSSDGCGMCPRGTVSLPNRSQCVTCVGTVYCPSGYEIPIQCVPGLLCNGSSIGAPPGNLFVVPGNCTVMIPCPNGTHCSLRRDKAILSGPFDNWFDLPVFVLTMNGSYHQETSCNTSFKYGVQRIDQWEDVWAQTDVLFWLAPLVCPSGLFLEGDACMSCPYGHYSSQAIAYSNATCQLCPAGTYQNQTGAYGSGMCTPCEPGTFSSLNGVAKCESCLPGFYQSLHGQLECNECPIAHFAETLGNPVCQECPRDTFQNVTGMSHCWACEASEFSSVGDVACTSCLSKGEPPNPWCETPRMPVHTSSIWLSVRGTQDECLGQGVSYFEDDETLVKPIYVNATTATCYHSLRVLGRPDLAQDWAVTVKDVRRPTTVEVIPFNATFYPVLCQSQGFSVLFVARDNRSESMIDISDMTVNLQLRDFNSEGLLYQVTCSHIPVQSEDVIYGTCKTSNYCPTQKVQVIVVLTWPLGSVRGVIAMTPAPVVLPQSTLNWVMSFQVQTPGIPYFAGDTVKIQVNSVNTYGTIAVFRFAVSMGTNVIFRRFTSVYTVVSGVQNGTLSVVGQTSSDVGNVLGLIELTVLTATQGVNEIARVLGSFCEITLSDSVSYLMSSRLSIDGYVADPVQPVIYLLMDVPRYSRLIARPRKTMLIQWQAVSASAVMFPTQIKVLGVMNIMGRYAYVAASCASLSEYLTVTSCDNIKARGSGAGSSFARVSVSFQGLSATIGFAVFVPRPTRTVLFPRSLALKGHYKLLSDFYAGEVVIPDVDVSPYVDPMTLRVSVNDQVWSCIGDSTFTIGSASGVCGVSGARNASSVFVWNKGVTGLGQYLLIPSRITPDSPHGALMVFDDAGDLLVPERVTSGDTRRLLVTVLKVELVMLGETSRCVGIDVGRGVSFLVPVWSVPPRSLQVDFSSSMLLSRLDSSGLISYSASVTRVQMRFDMYSTGIDISSNPPMVFAMSNDTLEVQGLTVSTTNAYGKFLVGVMLLENSCIAGSYLFNVVRRAAGDPVLDCGTGSTMTLPDDPMSIMFPSMYPSGFRLNSCLLRYPLVDGSVKTVSAVLQLGGTSNATVIDGMAFPTFAGTIEIRDLRASNVVVVQVVSRVVVSMSLACNAVTCNTLKLTKPGDGASLPPFSYGTQLSVDLKVILVDGTKRDLTVHALGVDVCANGVSLLSSLVPLSYGVMPLDVLLSAAWQLSNFSQNVTVVGITTVEASIPSVIRQIHGSGIWEEAVIVATARLSDGVGQNVAASFTCSAPLVQHANGRFHLDYFAENVSVLVSFGGKETLVWMGASEDSVCITDIDISFLPVEWTDVANSMINLLPALTPRLSVPWTPAWNLSSRVVTWTSMQPSVLAINPAQASAVPKILLLDDYYEAVSVIAELQACGPGMSAVTKSVHVTPNIVPNVDGQLDFGQQTGLMVPATDVNSLVSVGVYVYASRALQTFTLEVAWPNQAMDVESCTPSDIRDSQCVLSRADDSTMYVRSVGSYVSSILSGRVRLATLEVHVKLQALVEISLNVPQLVAYGKVWRNISKSYQVMLGGMHVGRRLLSVGGVLLASRRLLGIPQGPPQVWGDADGDGECTSLDVQFLQLYLMNQAFTGDQQICVAACQWRSTLTAWQLSQLNPVRDPLGGPVPPDGSSVLFYLRALVRKTHFLSDWRVNVTEGGFKMFVEFTDYTGRLVPASTSVRIALNTQLNTKLGFSSDTKEVDGWLQVDAQPDVNKGGYSVETTPNAVVLAEFMVPVKILIETFDIRGQPALDRQFTFFTSRPFTFVSLLSLNESNEEPIVVPHVPIQNCTDLCEDVLYFDDFYTGIPSWAGNVLGVRFVIRAPSMRTPWFTVKLLETVLDSSLHNVSNTTQKIVIVPWCSEVILWSYLGGVDETCTVNVTEEESLTTEQHTCSRYPCWITYANLSYQVAIPTLIPYRPKVILQQNVIREFGKTPWIATVSLWGDGRNYMDVAVTQSVLTRGLIYAYPATSVVISPRWIQGVRTGVCAIYFGRMAASVNVTLASQEVVRIEAFAFRGAQVGMQTEDMAEIVWTPPRFPAGSVGYMIVRAVFIGGFTIRLDLRDGARIEPVHSSIHLRSDGSFEVQVDAGNYQGALLAVQWNGKNTTVNGSLLSYTPSMVRACCPQYVTYPSSPATGLGDYKSRFTLDEIVVSFTDHPSERVLLTDHRISLEYNANYLSYAQGYWTVLDEPGIPLGPTTILVRYTHPVSLLQVTTETYMIIMDARDLLVTIQYDPGTLANQLWRLHCSDTFQTAYIQAFVDLEIEQVDVTSGMQVLSSNPKAIRVYENELRGVAPGVSEILVFYRGFAKSMQIEVVGGSLPLIELQYLDPRVVLQGPRLSVYPVEIGGFFQGQDGAELIWFSNVTFVSPMIETSPELTLQPGYLVQALANTYDSIEERDGYIIASVAACDGFKPDDLVVDVIVNLNMSATNETGLDIGSQLAEAMIPHGSMEVPLWIHVGSGAVSAYYIELHTDLKIQECMRGPGTVGFFECTLFDPMGTVRLAGTRMANRTGMHHAASLLVLATTGNESVCGHVEVFGDTGVKSFNMSTGLLGRACGPRYDDVNPLVDPSVIWRDYQCVSGITSPCESTNVTSWYHMLLLVHKQRHVIPVVYSNDLELSVMVQVLDRFSRPDTSQVQVNVTLFTDKLPIARGLSGSTQVGEHMTISNVQHYKDGWYLVQWRQKIPVINLTVMFQLATVDDTGQTALDRQWIMPPLVVNLTTGRALSNCPHSVYEPGFLQSSYVLYVSNATNLTFRESSSMQKTLACSIDSTERRVQITGIDNTRISVTVHIESFMRLHEMNSYLLDLDFMKTALLAYNRTLLKVERGLSRYLSSPPDPQFVCPVGFFINQTADLEPLPQHADSGPDCYGFICRPEYEQYGPDCIPKTTDDRVFWSSILMVLTLVLAIIVTSCLMRVSAWGLESKPTAPIPETIQAEPEPPKDPTLNMLPVDVVEIDGTMSLVFEEDCDSSSSSESCSEQDE